MTLNHLRRAGDRSTARSRLLASSALLGSVAAACLFAPPTASAQCAPDPATDGDDVVCSGTDTDGTYVEADGVTLTVNADASVTREDGWGVFMAGNNNTFTNRGTIRARVSSFSGAVTLRGSLRGVDEETVIGINDGDIASIDGSGSALDLRKGVLSFHNREGGTLSASLFFAPAVLLSNEFRGVFENSGTISAENGQAIFAFTSSSAGSGKRVEVINNATGLIQSLGGSAIFNTGGDTLHVTNAGSIKGAIGVEMGSGSSVTNLAGGVIEGTTSSGLLSTNFVGTEPAVRFANLGVIRGVTAAVSGGSFVLDNSGEIAGKVVGNYNNQLVSNSGSIAGSIDLGDGQDAFENTGAVVGDVALGAGRDLFRDYGGSIDGSVDLGDGDDIVLVKPGADRTDITASLQGGAGFDSFGFSVEGEASVSLDLQAGFEGIALESRFEDSVATIAGAQSELQSTLTVFGDGTIINLADFNLTTGDAVRFLSNAEENIARQIEGPFGRGVSFTNRGSINAANGFAFRSVGETPTLFTLIGGDETITNEGTIAGAISLDAGNDTILNEGQIVGDVSLASSAVGELGEDNDTLINNGSIDGTVNFGHGDDLFVNSGQVTGLIDLGAGDDTYLTDISDQPASGANPVSIVSGSGFDAIGFSTTGRSLVRLSSTAGFEAAAARADGADALMEIVGVTAGESLNFLRVLGTGTVVNNADVVGDVARLGSNQIPAVSVMSGVTFENNGNLGGPQAIRITGDGATVTNNADIVRGSFSGDSTGNTGVIEDGGVGTTLVNNGDIHVTPFSTSAVFIGSSVFSPFGYDYSGDITTAPRTTFVNNGSLSSDLQYGLNVRTYYGVDITNNGEIDDIAAERSESDILLTNSGTGTIGAISVGASFYPNRPDGSFFVVNDGLIEVASGAAIDFRDYPIPIYPLPIFDDHVTNSGTIIGDILFNSGDDTFTIVGNGEVNGQVDGGADTDTLNFQDLAGDLDASSFANFLNFETLGISTTSTARIASVSGDLSAFERLVIRSGQTNLATDINIDTQVAAPATLGGAGVISGDVSLDGRLAPSAGNALRIGGDLLFADTSGLDLQVSGNGASQLIVDGAATLSGARVLYTVSDLPQLDLDLGASLQFNGARTGTFSSLDFFGDPASRTTIGANAGFNGLFDSLDIQQGIVLVESDLIGNVHVGAAGVLGGNGAIFGDVTAEGLVSPGASVGALTINGNLNMSPQSMLAIETGATGTDLLTVTGNAQLGGQLLFAGDPTGVTRQRSFRFLDVGGSVSGSFDTITVGAAFSGLTNVSVGPDGLVSLVLTPQIAIDPSGPASSQAAASYFNNLIASGQATTASDAILLATNMLAGSPAALDSAMASLQPEIYASSIYAGGRQALAISDTLRPRLTRAAMRRSGFSAWLSASDGSSETDGGAARGLSGFSTDTFSTIGGIEYGGQGFLIGGYAGAINTDQLLDNAAGSTSADGAALGAYAAADLGLAQSSLSVGYIDSDASSRRTVSFLGESLTADHDLTVFTAQADIQSSMDVGSATFTPLFGATFAHVERGAASEFGGNAALDIEEVAEDLLYLDAGATISQSFDLDSGMSLTPSLWAGWRYELLAPSVSARGGLTGTATSGLYSRAAQPDRSRITLRAALAAEFTRMVSGSISYEAELADNADAGVVSAGLSLRF